MGNLLCNDEHATNEIQTRQQYHTSNNGATRTRSQQDTHYKDGQRKKGQFKRIEDNYETYEQVIEALIDGGLEECNLIIGVDLTESNTWQGERKFSGRNLHETNAVDENGQKIKNPYQRVIASMSRVLSDKRFDEDGIIPFYGFGDLDTKGTKVKHFGNLKDGFDAVLRVYEQEIENIELAGGTNFGPMIQEAVRVIKKEKGYHILLIITDGSVSRQHMESTRRAIVEASKYPLSIVVVGVGDGSNRKDKNNWRLMKEFDNDLPSRSFDNFQFVDAHKYFKRRNKHLTPEEQDAEDRSNDVKFAKMVMQEIPKQYSYIIQDQLLERRLDTDHDLTHVVKHTYSGPVPETVCEPFERTEEAQMNNAYGNFNGPPPGYTDTRVLSSPSTYQM